MRTSHGDPIGPPESRAPRAPCRESESAAERLAFLKLASSWLEIAHDAELHRGDREKDPFRPTFT
jgi:hypothetical protein